MQSDTPRPARSNRIHRWLVELTLLALVLAAAGVVLFSGLGDSAPVGDEALHAIISHDSAAAHRWLPLRLPSGPYYMMKPPLRFLINIAIMRWCGTEMRLLRFPDAFFGWLTVALVYLFCRWAWGRLAALSAAGILLGADGWLFVHGVRNALTDGLSTLLATAMLCSWLVHLERPQRRGWALGACVICACLAELTRPFCGLAMSPLLALLTVALAGSERIRRLRDLMLVVGGALLMSALWVGHLISLSPSRFLHIQELNLVVRATRGLDPAHLQGSLFYSSRIVHEFGPWLLLLAIVVLWPRLEASARDHRLAAGLALWILGLLAVLSAVPSKLPWYIYPAYPALAMLLGCAAHALYGFTTWRSLRVLVGAFMLLGLTVDDVHSWRRTSAVENSELATFMRAFAELPNAALVADLEMRQQGWPTVRWRDLWPLITSPGVHWAAAGFEPQDCFGDCLFYYTAAPQSPLLRHPERTWQALFVTPIPGSRSSANWLLASCGDALPELGLAPPPPLPSTPVHRLDFESATLP